MIRKLPENKYLLSNMPMPPSVNDCYPGKERRFASFELKQYKNHMQLWGLTVAVQLRQIASELRTGLGQPGVMLKVERQFFFHAHRVLTKQVQARQLDHTNFIKCLDDAVCALLQIDDKYIWESSELKIPVAKPTAEQTSVILSLVNISTQLTPEVLEYLKTR